MTARTSRPSRTAAMISPWPARKVSKPKIVRSLRCAAARSGICVCPSRRFYLCSLTPASRLNHIEARSRRRDQLRSQAMIKPPNKRDPRKRKLPMLPADRLDYSAITERAPLKLPDGARMVVWVIVNVGEGVPTQPMPRTLLPPPAGGAPSPDVPNGAWHEYGNRVGFWRFTKIFDEFDIPVVLAINGAALAA